MPPITTMMASNKPSSRAKHGLTSLLAAAEASLTLRVYQKTPKEHKQISGTAPLRQVQCCRPTGLHSVLLFGSELRCVVRAASGGMV
jgi:hypothetical protein